MLGEIMVQLLYLIVAQCILKGVANAFSNAIHGVCVQNLMMNVNANFKNMDVKELINKTVYSYRTFEFNYII